MSTKIYTKRQQNLRNVLDKKSLDGMLITNLTNVRYISGFTGSAASCLFTPEGQYFITDGRYIEQSKNQVIIILDLLGWILTYNRLRIII